MSMSNPSAKRREPLVCKGDRLTKQSFKDKCDINKIVNGYRKHGVITHVRAGVPVYDDVSNVPDYQTALNVVRDANLLFSSLPAKIRARFGNDPERMVAFVADERNRAEAQELGMLKPVVKPAEDPPKKADEAPK